MFICVYSHLFMYLCFHVFICVYIHIFLCVYFSVFIFKPLCICMYIFLYMHTPMAQARLGSALDGLPARASSRPFASSDASFISFLMCEMSGRLDATAEAICWELTGLHLPCWEVVLRPASIEGLHG